MGLILTSLLAFVGSYLAAGMLAVGMAQLFALDEAFILVLIALSAFVIGSIVYLAVVYRFARRPDTLDRAAQGLVLAIVAILVSLAVGSWMRASTTSLGTSAFHDLRLVATAFAPALLAIVIQWWALKRRWRRKHGGATP